MRVVYWGTYDTGKPRNRIIIKGLRSSGVEVIECHRDIWKGVEDKSQIGGVISKLLRILRWLLSYPGLIFEYLRLPPHDVVIVGYMGQLDILVLWPFAKCRRIPIVWDAFLSLYDTVVCDRKIIGSKHPLACILYAIEFCACRAANSVILDTMAHCRYFIEKFKLLPEMVECVFVGAEDEVFTNNRDKTPYPAAKELFPFTILFYGQFIPLHGVEIVVNAAKLTTNKNLTWIIIGKGQESAKIDALCKEIKPTNLLRIDWVSYSELLEWINKADIGLGIFGNTEKARRVIPNKVFQLLMAGCPLITGDTPAARELLTPSKMISLIPMADPVALAAAVEEMISFPANEKRTHDLKIIEQITPKHIGMVMKKILQKVIYNSRSCNG